MHMRGVKYKQSMDEIMQGEEDTYERHNNDNYEMREVQVRREGWQYGAKMDWRPV